jgi:hypothetical protein
MHFAFSLPQKKMHASSLYLPIYFILLIAAIILEFVFSHNIDTWMLILRHDGFDVVLYLNHILGAIAGNVIIIVVCAANLLSYALFSRNYMYLELLTQSLLFTLIQVCGPFGAPNLLVCVFCVTFVLQIMMHATITREIWAFVVLYAVAIVMSCVGMFIHAQVVIILWTVFQMVLIAFYWMFYYLEIPYRDVPLILMIVIALIIYQFT